MACALYYARRFDDSIRQCRWVLETEPNFVTAHFRIGLAYEQLVRYAEAAEAFQSAIALSADDSKAEAMAAFKGGADASAALAHTYALEGDHEAARSILKGLEEQAASAYVPPHDIALIYSALGEADKAFEWLKMAYQERFSLLVLLELDPRFDSLRADPRFTNLLSRIADDARPVASQKMSDCPIY